MTFKVRDGLSVGANTILDSAGNLTVPGTSTLNNTTITGQAQLNGGDAQTIVQSKNSTASLANQFFIKHNLAAVEIGNSRGNINVTAGALQQAGNQVLHAANYNDYAPTKIGTGASGTWSIAVTGNAGTATTLQTARTIGGVSFNGSTNINLPGVNAVGNQNTSGNAATATALATPRNINGVAFNGSADITVAAAAGTLSGTTINSTVTASSLTSVGTLGNLAVGGSTLLGNASQILGSNSSLVVRHSGAGTQYGISLKPDADNTTAINFFNAAGTSVGSIATSATVATFTGAFSGNASTATILQNTRTINGVGFNGSININITAPTPFSLSPGSYISGLAFDGSVARTWNINAATANTASTVVARDASGNFSAGTITAALTGSATQLGGIAAANYVRTDTAQSITARKTFSGNQASAMATATGSLGAFEVINDGTNAAFIAFHRSGAHAAYFGIDTDNVLKYGGWSLGTTASPIVLANGASWNISVSGSSASCTGNSATATTLQTARNINGVPFNGSQAITITASTPNSLSPGSYISGSAFDGSVARTWNINAAEASTVSTVVARNGSGDINVRLVRSEYQNEAYCNGGLVFRVNNTTDNFLRTCSDAGAIRTFIGAYAATNPNGYTTNTGTVTSVGATSPVVSSGGTAPTISMGAASSGVNGYMTGAYATKLDGIAAGATNVTNTNQLTNGAGYITSSGRAYPRRSDGGDINFYWAGQSGQPPWLWGGSDGTNMYVYNPSNFSVNYATSAGSASNATFASGATNATYATSAGSASNATYATGAGNAGTAGSATNATYATTAGGVSIDYNNDSNAEYQMLWGSGTGVYGTGGIRCNPATDSFFANGNITAYANSDSRLKENIKDIETPLEKVIAIGGKTYDWTDEYLEQNGGADDYFFRKQDFGVIAQDVEAVFPVAVRTKETGTLAVDYEKLVALSFAAIKELNLKVEALQKQLNSK